MEKSLFFLSRDTRWPRLTHHNLQSIALSRAFFVNADKLPRSELARRLEGYSTYTADFMVGDHQLFYVATTDIVDAQQRILQRERDIDALLRVLPC